MPRLSRIFGRLFVRIFAIALLVFPTFAYSAGWSRGAVAAADQFGYFPGPRSLTRAQRGEMASVWGGGMREVRFNEDLGNDELKLKIPSMFKAEIKVFLRKQDHVAPLIVFVPGVFANANDGIARASVKWFSSLGYHVLTMPNCWSTDFAKARPSFKEEYPGGEASAVIAITKAVIAQELGSKMISSVQIMGESLGALTAAVVYAKDSKSARPIFSSATLTWPPIELYSAMKTLDTMMDNTDHIYASKCHHLIKRLVTKWHIIRGHYLTEPTNDEIACAPAIVSQYSFRKEIVKLAKAINKAEHLQRLTPDNLTFDRFIRNFAPRYQAALTPNDQYGSLQYWLRETDPQAARNVRILTSEDDFLNQDQTWDFGFFTPSDSQLIVAHWGGHIGLSNTKEYERFLKAEFALH